MIESVLIPTPAERRPIPHFRQHPSLSSTPVGKNRLTLLCFRLGEDDYAMTTDRLLASITLRQLGETWRVVNSKLPFFRHFSRYRTTLIPLIDLRRLWSIPHDVYDLETPILIVQLPRFNAGFFVDQVLNDVQIFRQNCFPLPPWLFGRESAYFTAMLFCEGRLTALCNEQTLLTIAQQDYIYQAQQTLARRQKAVSSK